MFFIRCRGGWSQIRRFKAKRESRVQRCTLKESEVLNAERMGDNRLKHWEILWSSYKGLTVDTLAYRGDEGRGYLR